MLLELKNVCKEYYRGKSPVPVLKNVNLQVEKGEYIAIMGPSGSGKTTLMNLIGCLDLPTAGACVLDGQEVGELNDNALADIRNRSIGFVFQNFHLLPKMTALDNVALPLLYAGVSPKERRERARKALTAVGLADRMRFYPNQLSGGQSQRVAIARAIVTNPKLLLADEPTGALDSEAGQQIMDIFEGLAKEGMTIIMITHEQEIAARAYRICHIRDGQLEGGLLPDPPKESGEERKPWDVWDEPFLEDQPAEPMITMAREEPVFPELPIFPEESVSTEEPIFPELPIFPEESVSTEEPLFPELPIFPEESVSTEEPIFPELPIFPEEPLFPEGQKGGSHEED